MEPTDASETTSELTVERKRGRFELNWRGLVIEIRYCPDWLVCYRETYGYALAHLEVETIQAGVPLPITETGYRSHFDRPDNIEAQGGPIAFVRAWLDHAAEDHAWKKWDGSQRQYSLF